MFDVLERHSNPGRERSVGYDLHITRATDWLDSSASPIPLAEWLEYVESDSEMRLDGFAETGVGTGAIRYANEGLAVWTGYSGHREDGNKAWFDFRDERVVVKNPDDEIVAKMKQVANRLAARVLGDDGEEY